MRLGKKVKLNIAIAILLCMAFVVNIGSTLAGISYSLIAKGSVSADKVETYTDYAYANVTSGSYTYSTGVDNNQLSINYGFSEAHDLMIAFTATYSNTQHKANDFSLNFVNRDNWCVDTSSNIGSSTKSKDKDGNIIVDGNGDPVLIAGNTYYSLTSTTNTFSGVMYYMGALTGSGTMPILSGVTFYTSPNNSYEYIGDNLTVTLTPTFVKSNSTNYNANHSFKSKSLNSNAFSNWFTYMKGTALAQSSYMVYNAYANNSTALAYPSDYDWVSSSFTGLINQTESLYSNTAYRYNVNKVYNETQQAYQTTRTFSAVTAGNKYYGGLGVYVLPSADLVTVGVTITYYWQKDNVIDDSIPSNMVEMEYSSDLSEISKTVNGSTYTGNYYIDEIDGPTYIDILESIMLTAEAPYMTILNNGYSLVISGVTLSFETSKPSASWGTTVPTYEVNNSTIQSPQLVRIKDVSTIAKTYDVNVSLTNNGTTPIYLPSFTVKAELWHGDYTENHSAFTPVHDEYLSDEANNGKLVNGTFTYDTNIWNVAYNPTTSVFTFSVKTSLEHKPYIPSGYTINLISAVKVPVQSYPGVDDEGFKTVTDGEGNTSYTSIEIDDLWCSLEVDITAPSTVTSYSAGNYTGVETIVTGYYSTISANSEAYIYLRNNTRQNITSVQLSNLALSTFNTTSSTELLPRDRLNTSTEFTYTLTNCITNSTSTPNATDKTSATQTVLIRPNEQVMLYKIKPSKDAVVYTYQLSATLANGEENSEIDIVYNVNNQTAEIINNSDIRYEFRLISSVDLGNFSTTTPTSSYLVNPSDFIEVEDTTNSKYYYYYKGVICAHQCIKIFSAVPADLLVDYLEHTDGADATQYVSANYAGWNPPTEWLNAMQAIYGEPDMNNIVVMPVQ